MTSYPPEIEQFVQHQVASGKYPSREAFAIEAARRVMEYESARDLVKADIDAARAEVDLGFEDDWDPEEIKRELIERFDEHGQPR